MYESIKYPNPWKKITIHIIYINHLFIYIYNYIFANEVYDIKNTPFLSFNKNQLLQLLKLSATEIYFMFNQCLYLQTDGCAMGSPLGCSLDNIF